jgi:hypothetical protein
VRSDPVASILVVLEKQNYSIKSRPNGGFYENGIINGQLTLERELRTGLVEYLNQQGVSSEFQSIPAVLGPATEEALSWNSALGRDKFQYLLTVIPSNGIIYCRSGGFDCSATFTIELGVFRRSDSLLLWKGTMKSLSPWMLASTADSPSYFVKDLTARLFEDGVIRSLKTR